MNTKKKYATVEENPLYHDTWALLKNYRDAVWNLELAVQQVRNTFELEYDTTIEEFLESVYAAGASLDGTDIENYAKSIARSKKMLDLLNSAVDTLRSKHKHGEQYYWLLYIEEIVESLRPHILNISRRTYYRKRPEAVEALSAVLWGYTNKDCLKVLNQFFPTNKPQS